MKTPFYRWRLLPALIMPLLFVSWLDAAEPKKRRPPAQKPPSELKRAFNRIGDFFANVGRDLEELERRDRYAADPYPDRYPAPPQRYPLPGTGIYPVHPELEDYFLFRELYPHPRIGSTAPQQQRRSLTFPPPNPYLPFYQTLGRDRAPRQQPSMKVGSALSYQPLTPSAAGESPRGLGMAAPSVSDEPPDIGAPGIPSAAGDRAQLGGPAADTQASLPPENLPAKRPVLTNLPTAKPVPGRPGLVYPPGAEEVSGNMVDVRGFVPGQKVSDPRTGKIFLVP